MIIDTSQGDIEVVGDVKEFKTSIDPKNLEFITTLLSSNLYSDPEQSFIREIVSNAWDSHVEAGTTDTPVIVRFKDTYNDKSVTIRDYGVGLSPERFQEVYCNIGSSTKRESNDFIGGFGIGKYSSLACSNTVYITSYYEGTAYYYVMVKSGNSITTNLLMQKPTTERNGVEVTIKGIDNLKPYSKALDYIVFFPNVYVDGAENSENINNAKLKRFTNFAAASIPVSSKLLLGNVLYPCNKFLLPSETQQFISKLESTGIVIRFDVGEINITPNRESIIYNSETIKKITDRAAKAKQELESLISLKLSKDYDDIVEYASSMTNTIYYDPVTNEIVPYCGYRVTPGSISTIKITYRGHDLKDSISQLTTLLGMTVPNYKGVVYDGKIYTKNLPYRVMCNYNFKAKKILILNAKARLVIAAKLYLRENYDQYCIMTDITYLEFEQWVNDEAAKLNLLMRESDKTYIVAGIYDSLISRAQKLDLDSDTSYLKFKDDLSATKATGIPIKEAILHQWDERGWKERLHFKKFSEALDYIKKLKKGVVLANMDIDGTAISNIATMKGYVLIQARKDIVADLRKLNLKCIVSLEWLTGKDPLLSAVGTTLKHFPGTINTELVTEICSNLSREESEELVRVVKLRNVYGGNYNYLGLVRNALPPIDPYIEYLCIKLKNYIAKHTEAKAIVASSGIRDSILTTAVVMKTKAYKISGRAYKRVQNNKLLRVLCSKK